MNDIQDRELLMRQASERAARIREYRLQIIAMRTAVVNGRLRTFPLIDASRELGRGNCYWLRTGEAA
jgi:hypothetical protein